MAEECDQFQHSLMEDSISEIENLISNIEHTSLENTEVKELQTV